MCLDWCRWHTLAPQKPRKVCLTLLFLQSEAYPGAQKVPEGMSHSSHFTKEDIPRKPNQPQRYVSLFFFYKRRHTPEAKSAPKGMSHDAIPPDPLQNSSGFSSKLLRILFKAKFRRILFHYSCVSPTIICRMVLSVSRIPSSASRPTLRMVSSTSAPTMPSPPCSTWPFFAMS